MGCILHGNLPLIVNGPPTLTLTMILSLALSRGLALALMLILTLMLMRPRARCYVWCTARGGRSHAFLQFYVYLQHY